MIDEDTKQVRMLAIAGFSCLLTLLVTIFIALGYLQTYWSLGIHGACISIILFTYALCTAHDIRTLLRVFLVINLICLFIALPMLG